MASSENKNQLLRATQNKQHQNSKQALLRTFSCFCSLRHAGIIAIAPIHPITFAPFKSKRQSIK